MIFSRLDEWLICKYCPVHLRVKNSKLDECTKMIYTIKLNFLILNALRLLLLGLEVFYRKSINILKNLLRFSAQDSHRQTHWHLFQVAYCIYDSAFYGDFWFCIEKLFQEYSTGALLIKYLFQKPLLEYFSKNLECLTITCLTLHF